MALKLTDFFRLSNKFMEGQMDFTLIGFITSFVFFFMYNVIHHKKYYDRVDNNPNLCVKQTCGPPDQKKPKERLLAVIIGLGAGTFLILALVVIALHIRRKRQGK